MEIQKELKRDALQKILAQGQRADGRGKTDYRPIELVSNPLQNAEGSAICRLGRTQVLAGIKFDMAMPFADRPNEGILSTGCEFTPLGSHLFDLFPLDAFQPGPALAGAPAARQRAADLAPLGPRLVRDQGSTQKFFGESLRIFQCFNHLDAASLAPSARMNLRFHHPNRTAQMQSCSYRFLHAETRYTARSGYAKLPQDFFTLVFMNFHNKHQNNARTCAQSQSYRIIRPSGEICACSGLISDKEASLNAVCHLYSSRSKF